MMCNNFMPQMALPHPPYSPSMHFRQFPNIQNDRTGMFPPDSQRLNPQSQPLMLLRNDLMRSSTNNKGSVLILISLGPAKIGRLTIEERKQKIDRYRAKRCKRVWKKKISYGCRKRVADQRIRIKGRFVSKVEAITFKQNTVTETNIVPTNKELSPQIVRPETFAVVPQPNPVPAVKQQIKKKKEAKKIFSITPASFKAAGAAE